MPCIVHGAAKSWIQLSDFHFQMPAGVLTGAGGDHPPLPSFFPPKPKSCPQPTPSDVPLCHAPACCIFFEFQVLVFAPPHLASGIRHVRSLFPCSSRAQGLPQRWGAGGGYFHAHLWPGFHVGWGWWWWLQPLWLPLRRNPLIAGEVRVLCIPGIRWTVMI